MGCRSWARACTAEPPSLELQVLGKGLQSKGCGPGQQALQKGLCVHAGYDWSVLRSWTGFFGLVSACYDSSVLWPCIHARTGMLSGLVAACSMSSVLSLVLHAITLVLSGLVSACYHSNVLWSCLCRLCLEKCRMIRCGMDCWQSCALRA